jgi:redox-sensing transcriptional repressor
MNLPGKTVERLSMYRRLLHNCFKEGKHNIFSHEIASLMHIKPVQVRRDLMLISYSGSQSKGYAIKNLIESIGKVIDTPEGQKMAIVGVGNLGRAVIGYFSKKKQKLSIIAAFDIDPEKINNSISGIKCYHINEMQDIIKKENITIGVITVPKEKAAEIANKLVKSGIKGILNLTSLPLKVSSNIHLEEYDIITSLEKAAYFANKL